MKNLPFYFMMFLLMWAHHIAAQPNWTALDSGTAVDLNAVDFIDANTGIAVGANGTILKTEDGGAVWTPVTSGTSNTLHDVRYMDVGIVITGGEQGVILRSSDGGATWDIVQQSGQDYSVYGLAMDPESGHGIGGGSGNTIIWSDDYGVTWTFIEGGYMNNYYCACMANVDFGGVAGGNSIFQSLIGYTLNGGQSFSGQSFYPTFNNVGFESTSFGCHFFNSQQGFIVGGLWDGQGFLTSGLDWGNQFWDALAFDYPLMAVHFRDMLNGVVAGGNYMSTALIAETDDGGLTWENAIIQGNGHTLLDIVLIGNTGYAVGMSGEILKREITVTTDQQPLPEKLISVTPNPARDHVKMVVVGSSGKVIYKIINVHGRIIKQSYFDSQEMLLNVSDFKPMPYLIMFEVDGEIFTRKLVVL
jgi:hypothetical protein